LYNLKVE